MTSKDFLASVNQRCRKLLFRVKPILSDKRFLVSAGILVGTFLLFNYVVLPLYVGHGGTLSVPRVSGLSVDSARRVLDVAGLQTIEADTRADSKLPPGTVVAQNPLPEAVVKPGRRIYLTISGGEALAIVPSLRGRSLREAKFALERSGLRLGFVGFAESETFPENTIIDQSVGADARVARGAVVAITVSSGRVKQETQVPSVVGKNLSEAEVTLARLGLKVGNITYQPSFELVPNTIVDQYPRAGEPAPEGHAVDLFVVKVGRPEEEIQPPKK